MELLAEEAGWSLAANALAGQAAVRCEAPGNAPAVLNSMIWAAAAARVTAGVLSM